MASRPRLRRDSVQPNLPLDPMPARIAPCRASGGGHNYKWRTTRNWIRQKVSNVSSRPSAGTWLLATI
ncbi:hypothetical protein CHY08_30230 (plasmid) [Rhizobium leguminosarum bv. viciae]|nr:hypothetical protein CHY08_30230 [Rhizobium leguminosarum bv. viciae]